MILAIATTSSKYRTLFIFLLFSAISRVYFGGMFSNFSVLWEFLRKTSVSLNLMFFSTKQNFFYIEFFENCLVTGGATPPPPPHPTPLWKMGKYVLLKIWMLCIKITVLILIFLQEMQEIAFQSIRNQKFSERGIPLDPLTGGAPFVTLSSQGLNQLVSWYIIMYFTWVIVHTIKLQGKNSRVHILYNMGLDLHWFSSWLGWQTVCWA